MTNFQKFSRVALTTDDEQAVLAGVEAVMRVCREFAEKNPREPGAVEVKWTVHLGTDWTNKGQAASLTYALTEFFSLSPADVIENQIKRKQDEIRDLKKQRRRL